MVEVCGDKDLIQAAGGQTFDTACRGMLGLTLTCSVEDARHWYARLEELHVIMVRTWNSLFQIEGDMMTSGALSERVFTGSETQKGRELREWWESIEERIEGLPEMTITPWAVGPLGGAAGALYLGTRSQDAVTRMVAIAQDQVCMISTMRDYIRSYGKTPPKVPFQRPSKRWNPRDALEDASNAIGKKMDQALGVAFTGAVIIAAAYLAQPLLRKMTK